VSAPLKSAGNREKSKKGKKKLYESAWSNGDVKRDGRGKYLEGRKKTAGSAIYLKKVKKKKTSETVTRQAS